MRSSRSPSRYSPKYGPKCTAARRGMHRPGRGQRVGRSCHRLRWHPVGGPLEPGAAPAAARSEQDLADVPASRDSELLGVAIGPRGLRIRPGSPGASRQASPAVAEGGNATAVLRFAPARVPGGRSGGPSRCGGSRRAAAAMLRGGGATVSLSTRAGLARTGTRGSRHGGRREAFALAEFIGPAALPMVSGSALGRHRRVVKEEQE